MVLKKERITLQHNILSENIPIVVVLKALSGLSDHELMLLVAGSDMRYQDDFAVSFDDAVKAGRVHPAGGLEFIGSRVKMGARNKTPAGRNNVDQALDALANIVIAHVPLCTASISSPRPCMSP